MAGERLFGRLCRVRYDGNIGAPAAPLVKLHGAVDGGKDRVVAAHADAGAGMKLGAALAYDDVAGHDDLAAEFLDAEPLTRTVTAVARGTACLFMSHSGL